MSGTRSRLIESSSAPRSSAFLLVAIGCLGIAGHLVLLRELIAAYGGNEFSAGVTVAAWILCEALGAWHAGHARSSPSSLLSLLSVLTSLAAVPTAILVRPLLGVLPGEVLSIPLLLLATFAVVFLPAAAHGALFVTAAAIHVQGTPCPASNGTVPAAGSVGSAYVWEGIGTVLAGLACFLLLNRLPSLAIIALFSFPLAAALLQFHFSRPRPSSGVPVPALVAALLGVISASAFFRALPIERMAWGAAWRGQRVVAVSNSAYGKIVRLERSGQQLILYDGLPVLAVPPTQTERIEELSLLPVLCHPSPRRVLVLGHDLSIPAALARFRPDIEVATVQLDPLLARTSLSVLSSDSSLFPTNFSLIISDPVSFLGRPQRPLSDSATRDTYDCIILTDATSSGLGSSRLFALEFYRLCRSRLAPGGILATHGQGNPTGLTPDLARLLSTRLRTLKTAFDYVLPLAADFPLLLASDRPLNVATEALLARLNRLSQPPRLLDSGYVVSLLDPFRQQTLSSVLQPGTSSPKPGISTAASPRELFLNMVRENRLVSPAFGALYARLGSLSPRLLLFLGAALLLVGLAGARTGGRRLASAAPAGQFSRGFAILTSGFSGAAASSLLLFAWQVRFGSVFSGVALLVAAFMLGTVLGGIAGTRAGSRGPSPFGDSPQGLGQSGAFAAADIALAACAAAAIVLIRGGPAGVFLLANCLAGACLGFQFAVAGFIVGRSGPSLTARRPSSIVLAPEAAAHRAGVLTALDLLGGSLGGILTALVLVPVFGIGAAALSAGAVKLASALVQLAAADPGSQP